MRVHTYRYLHKNPGNLCKVDKETDEYRLIKGKSSRRETIYCFIPVVHNPVLPLLKTL